MKIKILGSGTILSSKERNPAGYLLEIENGRKYYLMDAGSGIMKQLDVFSFNVLKLDAVFISHFHTDHCADLLPILLRRYLLDKRANENFEIYGPKGLEVWFAGQSVFQGSWLSEHRPKLIELSNGKVKFPEFNLYSMLNGHTDNSISLCFRGERVLFYSSDTGYNRDLISFAKNADTALIECSLPDESEIKGHLTPSLTGRLAARIAAEKLVVTHIYPENDRDDLKERIAEYYPYEIIIAQDFSEIDV